MPKGICTIDGCEKPRKYRMYCTMHQDRYRKTGSPGPAAEKHMHRQGPCQVDDCPNPIRSRGLCDRHYDRWLRSGTTDPYVHEVKDCLAEGCTRRAWNRGMCSKHHSRWMKYGTTELPQRTLNRDLPCSVDGCEKLRRVGLYCEAHSKRFRKYGDPLGVAPPRPPVDELDLFWSKVTLGPADACWPWGGTVSSQGYGVYVIQGVQYKAHRLACSIGMEREIAPDKMACHRCSNPICCNPSHIYEGDIYTNADDMVAAGNSLRGLKHPKRILTPSQVQEIRAERGRTISRLVAARYGVSKSTVSAVWHGRVWKWLPWPGEICIEEDRLARKR